MSLASIALSLVMFSATGGVTEMFDKTSVDFGGVPRGTVNVADFTLKNDTNQTIRVSGANPSCSCTAVKVLKDTAAPGEDIVVQAKFNTSSFSGSRTVSIYVNFVEPRSELVTLRVSGVSRSDVMFSPSQVDLGVIPEGDKVTKSIKVEYMGSTPNFKIEEAIPAKGFDVTANEVSRNGNHVVYQVNVTTKPDMAAGVVDDKILLKTNDPMSPTLALQTQGKVEPPLSATPSAVTFDHVAVGQKVKRRIVLKGTKPFKIEWIDGEIDGVKVFSTEGERTAHMVEVEFEPKEAGKLEKTIMVKTDLNNEQPLPVRIMANVTK